MSERCAFVPVRDLRWRTYRPGYLARVEFVCAHEGRDRYSCAHVDALASQHQSMNKVIL